MNRAELILKIAYWSAITLAAILKARSARRLARCLLPASLCAHIFIKRETSGYEADSELFFVFDFSDNRSLIWIQRDWYLIIFFLAGQVQADNDLFLSIYSYLLVCLRRFYSTPFALIYRKFEHYNDPSFVTMFKYMVPLLIQFRKINNPPFRSI